MPPQVAFASTLVFATVMIFGSPFIGRLSDAMGPARVMTWSALGTVMLGIPLSAPFILGALIAATGSLLVPGFYLVAIAALSLTSVLVSRKVFAQR
jgi:MFS family permease